MLKVFISYRRAESEGWVRVLDAQLAKALGRDQVFCDVHSLLPGSRFEDHIRAWVTQSQVMLVIIGTLWTKVVGADGQRRLLDPKDLVRKEVELALGRRLIVVPVLVGDARVPLPEELPPRMRRLVDHSAASLRPASFDTDVAQLVEQLVEIGREVSASNDGAANGEASPPAAPMDRASGLSPEASNGDPRATGEDIERSVGVAHVSAVAGDSNDEPWRAAISDVRDAVSSPASRVVLAVSRDPADGSYRYEVAPSESAERPQVLTVPIGQTALELMLRRDESTFAAADVLRRGAVLYRLLVPRPLRALLAAATMLELRLDATTDRWPWERLVAPGAELPLSASIPIVRRALDAPPASSEPTPPVVSALALLGDSQDPQIFPPLPAAETEVSRITDVLRRAGLEAACRVRPSADEALQMLLAGEPDILHVTGHSVEGWLPDNDSGGVDGARQPLSGVLIGHRVVLTAHEIACAERLPVLITFGAEWVSSWALPLLAEGAHAVVAFGGPVADAPALDFFVGFYEALAGGAPAQLAMQSGRLRVARSSDPAGLATATLARLYGDADYRLTAAATDDPTRPNARRRLGIGTR
ncbi:CHAT domain-containing protein [Variovorax sp. GT1P44]|uniref:CHAT domain-containing protein n=1 Tax=Variovorax sp. GT1P44 TaxID=3443742 RepID=UPI003F464A97